MKQIILNQLEYHTQEIKRQTQSVNFLETVVEKYPANSNLVHQLRYSKTALTVHTNAIENLKAHCKNENFSHIY
jgi:hypothetical protein